MTLTNQTTVYQRQLTAFLVLFVATIAFFFSPDAAAAAGLDEGTQILKEGSKQFYALLGAAALAFILYEAARAYLNLTSWGNVFVAALKAGAAAGLVALGKYLWDTYKFSGF
ncbi:hypothetical protein FXB78_05845 [Aggregatibacter actinomycetemcomitans]|jgi:hypothetical protein|uniref:hypothetical protein n=1 Tax=Pasteurellaceae TaxID=712 RepID=UPI00066D62BA|nr:MULTISPECIES: hypothetical protein [Pasteurellaceae]TYB29188.1 hypothetical protein FXB78_05845 [Aggregatibacter actinomycetemcomitans]